MKLRVLGRNTSQVYKQTKILLCVCVCVCEIF